MQRRHFDQLDGLRGIAALWVALYHFWTGGHLDEVVDALPRFLAVAVFEQGFLGVPVFFVLSGFVIPYSASRTADRDFRPVRFMHRRWRRLSPPYYAALVLTVALGLLEEQVRDIVFDVPTPTEFIAHLLYLQDLADQERIGVIFWTLAFEMQFYVLFALMKWLSGRWGKPYAFDVLLALGLVVSIPWALGLTAAGSTRGVFIDNWYLFLIGNAVFQVTQRPAWRYPTAAYVVLLAFASPLRGGTWTGAGAATATLVAILVFTSGSPVERVLSTRAAKFVGMVSYSLYLIHNAVAGPMYYVIYEVVDRTLATEAVALFAVTVGQLTAAWVWYQIFEKSAMAWSRRLRGPTSDRPTGSALSA